MQKNLAKLIIEKTKPIREKRKALENNPKLIDDVLEDGAMRATKIAEQTLEEVRSAMKI